MALSAFIFAVFFVSTESFQSNTNFPFAIPFEQEEHRFSTNQPADVVSQFRKPIKKPKYDLGIGKNKPVIKFDPGSLSHEPYNENAGEFIIEHEAVREYPAPSSEALQATAVPKKTNLPKVQPRRRAQDLLAIHHHPNGVSDNHPVMVPIRNLPVQPEAFEPLKLDPNTIWVEMMLHDELTKLVPCNCH